jgi:hypothetical protein
MTRKTKPSCGSYCTLQESLSLAIYYPFGTTTTTTTRLLVCFRPQHDVAVFSLTNQRRMTTTRTAIVSIDRSWQHLVDFFVREGGGQGSTSSRNDDADATKKKPLTTRTHAHARGTGLGLRQEQELGLG